MGNKFKSMMDPHRTLVPPISKQKFEYWVSPLVFWELTKVWSELKRLKAI